MAGSPTWAFRGLSLTELEALRASAIARLSGDTIQLSGAGKSKGKNYSMSVADELKEINFAIDQLSGGTIRKTYYDARQRGCSQYPGTTV